MQLEFTKMQALGNDYLYLDCRRSGPPPQAAQWAVRLSRRRFGVGADGLICLCPPLSADGDAAMRIWNADGSEGEMCGNGVRCAAEYLYTHGAPRGELRIDTPAGRKTLRRLGPGLWRADLGRFAAGDCGTLTAAGHTLRVRRISMGNPHCVVPCPDAPPRGEPLAVLGAAIERHPMFPHRTNVEFVHADAPDALTVTVWERGSGATLACGTGACAAAAAMVLAGQCPRGVPLTVRLPGGSLTIEIADDDAVALTGEAVTVFCGRVEV